MPNDETLGVTPKILIVGGDAGRALNPLVLVVVALAVPELQVSEDISAPSTTVPPETYVPGQLEGVTTN